MPLSLLLLVLGAATSLTVPDDTGAQVTVPNTPQRIVSLAPGATEMLFAAGAGAHVIATVDFADEPAAARRIPRIGDVTAVDMERLVALHPDVVVVWPGGGNPAQSKSSSCCISPSIANRSTGSRICPPRCAGLARSLANRPWPKNRRTISRHISRG